jgi:FkbH-like protein
MPDEPAAFVRALDRERLFEAANLTDEDLVRTTTYHARRETVDGLSEATDQRSFLASLQMTAQIRPFEPVSFERITQLVNKTNQFNLTTPRVVQATIEQMASDPTWLTRTIRLRDRFGDHGLISVLVGRLAGHRLTLDTWLMSCRALGRGVEFLLFDHIIAFARQHGVEEIIGHYRPTDRNGLVKEHYAKLGFSRGGDTGGVEVWRIDVAHAPTFDVSIATDDR